MASSSKGIYRVLAAAGGYGLLSITFIATLAEGYAKARIAFDGGKMLDAALARNGGAMLGSFFIVLVFILVMACGIFIKDSLLGKYLEKGMLRLRKITVESLGKAKMSWLDRYHSGKLSARVMSDLNALSGALRPVLIMGISGVIFEIVCIVFMFMTNWLLTLIVFAIVPVTTLLQWLSSHPIKKYRQANQEAVGQFSSVVFDCFGSFESIKSLNLEDEMQKRFSNAQEKQVNAAVKETRIVAVLVLLSGIGKYLPQLVLLVAGGIFVIQGRMTLGQLTMFIALSSSVILTVGNIGSLLANIRQLSANADRIVELWDSPKEQEKDNVLAVDRSKTLDFALCFDHVCFKYRQNEENVLSDISFSLKPGDFAAFVGESGCGKSTAMKLAVSLYTPQSGSVKILGRNVSDCELSSLRSHIAYVTQDTYLFPGTLRDNICGDDVSQELLEECIQAAQLSAFVKSLPAGLDTEVGERGVFLSGGQRQRISIARALYKKADLLFLDEATSALDRSTEEAVLQGILNKRGSQTSGINPTLIAITHSLANVRNADCIVVFKDGCICETGTHETLVAHNGEYARLLARHKEDSP
jgi:ABC-type multidrug transport system fused ATPase/permease subunit